MTIKIDFKEAGLFNKFVFKGLFDLKTLYQSMYLWFDQNKYDFYEKLYKEKPPELEIEWFAEKKETDFVKFNIHVNFHFWDLQRGVKAVKKGKETSLANARFKIMIWGEVEIDYQGRWEGSFFKEKVLNFIVNHVMKQDIDFKYVDKLYYQVEELTNLLKKKIEVEGQGEVY